MNPEEEMARQKWVNVAFAAEQAYTALQTVTWAAKQAAAGLDTGGDRHAVIDAVSTVANGIERARPRIAELEALLAPKPTE